MTSLPAIVRATRKSGNAVTAMQKWARRARDAEAELSRAITDQHRAAETARLKDARRNLKAAETRHANAQRTLDGYEMALATMRAL